ncbi:hypothetical protein E2C01_099466 [Portunus trituberculatus]|uniref:Uncharacterized protein n=1 Tax=Portunus trituberculatus TaxID=210409 RepID=A0A5B7K0F4_PORTR|nr:hypothetical protein [Portunus trituberculatus]
MCGGQLEKWWPAPQVTSSSAKYNEISLRKQPDVCTAPRRSHAKPVTLLVVREGPCGGEEVVWEGRH